MRSLAVVAGLFLVASSGTAVAVPLEITLRSPLPAETPVRAKVTLRPADGRDAATPLVRDMTTAGSATFEVEPAVPGEWTLDARAAGGLIADGVTVELRKDASVEGLRLVVKKPQQVSGLIVGPDGQGVSGALVLGRLEPHQRKLRVILEQQWTKVDGQFSLRLPPGADSVQLTVFAPGFGVTQVRANPASKEPLVIPVRQVGGSLVLNYDRALGSTAQRHAIKLFGEFELGHWSAVEGWLRLHGLDPSMPGQLIVPMLAPGTYTACLDVGFLASIDGGSAPPGATPRCVSGELAPGGELVLDVPAPPAGRSDEAAPPPSSR